MAKAETAAKTATKPTVKVEEVVPECEVVTQMLRVGQQTPEVRLADDGRIEHIGGKGGITAAILGKHIEAMTACGFKVASFEVAAVERDGSLNLSFVWVKAPDGVPYKQWALVIRPGLDGEGMKRANSVLAEYVADGFKIEGHHIFNRSANYVSVLWWLTR